VKGGRSELRLRKLCTSRYGMHLCLHGPTSNDSGPPLSIVQIVPSNWCFTPRMVSRLAGTLIKRKVRNCAVAGLTSGRTRVSRNKWRSPRLGISTLVGVNIIEGAVTIDVYFRHLDFVLGFEMGSAGRVIISCLF
jgi:hypothetical protein